MRDRKNAKLTIGALAPRSIITNATSATAATARSEITRADPQRQLLPSTSASTSAVSPIVTAAMPA